ncbi:hypothetical protein [Clostridium chrysemydis]|uniref:hypothetical protein n=1 Tax=Clostridium chrysemydis TaxID=2665504 RepID=UPI0018835F36|nr:hypothetical protein [Clostridium chrysemydis]
MGNVILLERKSKTKKDENVKSIDKTINTDLYIEFGIFLERNQLENNKKNFELFLETGQVDYLLLKKWNELTNKK